MKEVKKEISKLAKKYVISELYDDSITIEEFKKYLTLIDDKQMCCLFNYVCEYTEERFIVLKKILKNEEYLNAAKKIANMIKRIDEYIAESIFDYLYDYEFVKFINLIQSRVLVHNQDVFNLKKKYNKVKNIKNWDQSSEMLSNWLVDPIDYNISDMNNYCESRNKYYENEIRNNNYEPKNIAMSYFQKSLLDIKKIAKTTNIYNEYTLFDQLQNQENQLNFIKKADNNKMYFDFLNLTLKEQALCDFEKKLNLIKIKNNKIQEFNGQDFLFLIHRIKGLLEENITNKLINDINEWDKHYENNSFISCSLINQFYLAFTEGMHLTLGFNSIKKDDIIAMNTRDMCFLKKYIILNTKDYISNYMSVDDLLINSENGYNEVVINRYRNKNAVMPDYLVAFDKIDDLTKEASKSLNVPIYLIILEKYADLLVKKLNYLKENDINTYLKFIKRFQQCLGYKDCPLLEYYDIIVNSDAFITDNEEANKIIRYIK